MANTDFGILLKTLLDKSGINSELEQVQKIVNKYTIDIMPELKTASLKNQMKAVSQEIANDFNKAFGTNLTGNDVFRAFENQAKQAERAIKEEAKAIETARKEQESLTNAMAKGREQAELSRQAEQKRQQMAQNNAINKALEQEYQERQKNIEAAKKQAELDRQNALAFTKSASERLSSAISKYSYGDTSDANAMMKQMNRGLSNFGDLSNVQGNITQLSSTIDKIIADLKVSHEQSLQALNEEIRAEQTLQSQKDAFNKKNINAIDYEIQKREEEARAFSSMLQAQMQEQQKMQSEVNKIQFSTDITKIENDYKRFGIVSQEVENNLKELKIARENALKSEGTDRASAEIEKYNQKLAETKSSWKELQATQVSVNQRTSQMTEMQEWMRKNKNATKLCGDQVERLIKECQTCDKIRFDGIKNEFKELQVQAGKAGKLGNTLWGSIIEQGKSFIQWTGVSGLVMSVWHSFKQGATNVKKLDDSLVELSKVSDLSAQGLENITEEAFELGEQLSKTGTDVLDATTNFKRAGYDIADSMKYAEEALKTTNISENLKDAGEAASSLVNIMKGFQDETPEFASKINDAVNQVSNTEAVDFDNLIDGATRLSAVADQAGMSFEQMLGTLTGGYEILGNMEKVATGQITIFSRLQAIQLEGEEEVSTVAKLQEKFSNATKGSVNIVDQTTGQLRNVYDILDDMANVWDSLDKNTREALAIEAAGIRQKNVFLALMQNWNGVEDAVESAKNSLGSADEENKKYLDSLSGRIENFESATQHLSKTLIDSDLLKFFVDLGTTGVKAIDGLIESIGTLGAIGLLGGAGLGIKNVGTVQLY